MWFHYEKRCHCFIYWAICRKIACYDFSYSLQKCWVFEWKVKINKVQNCCSERFWRHNASKYRPFNSYFTQKSSHTLVSSEIASSTGDGVSQTASRTHSCGAFICSGCLVCILGSARCFPLALSFASLEGTHWKIQQSMARHALLRPHKVFFPSSFPKLSLFGYLC